jgi:hypothetical protein
MISILCCVAAYSCAPQRSVLEDRRKSREISLEAPNLIGDPMRHFNQKNRHEIKDNHRDIWATVLFSDAETFSELSRRGFYLVDMRGEVWTMRRAA